MSAWLHQLYLGAREDAAPKKDDAVSKANSVALTQSKLEELESRLSAVEEQRCAACVACNRLANDLLAASEDPMHLRGRLNLLRHLLRNQIKRYTHYTSSILSERLLAFDAAEAITGQRGIDAAKRRFAHLAARVAVEENALRLFKRAAAALRALSDPNGASGADDDSDIYCGITSGSGNSGSNGSNGNSAIGGPGAGRSGATAAAAAAAAGAPFLVPKNNPEKDDVYEDVDTDEVAPGKRQRLPKSAVSAMRDWMQRHWDNPTPSEEQKAEFVRTLGITKKQTDHWFINERGRVWRPAMKKALEEAQRSGSTAAFLALLSNCGRDNLFRSFLSAQQLGSGVDGSGVDGGGDGNARSAGRGSSCISGSRDGSSNGGGSGSAVKRGGRGGGRSDSDFVELDEPPAKRRRWRCLNGS